MYFHQLDNTHYTGSCQYSTPPPRPRPRRVKETRTNKPAFAASTPASINAGPTALNGNGNQVEGAAGDIIFWELLVDPGTRQCMI